ncbi:MAG: Uma2 family endonuclease [Candidatus Helarchaeota archaeon]
MVKDLTDAPRRDHPVINRKTFVSTRHLQAEEVVEVPQRLGRRESEPHSKGIMELHDVLVTNFPSDRTLPDLHHYFRVKNEKIDIQFDLSYFRNFQLDYELSSYDAEKFKNKFPDMAVNILSKSTYLKDLGYNVDLCKEIGISVYVLFSTHNFSVRLYEPPFLRVYRLKDGDEYEVKTIHGETLDETGTLIKENIIETSPPLPFNIGVIKRGVKFEGGTDTYKLILINPKTLEIYKTKEAIERLRADKEKARADKEKARADRLEKVLEEYKRKYGG